MLWPAALCLLMASLIVGVWARYSSRPVSAFNRPVAMIAASFLSLACAGWAAHDPVGWLCLWAALAIPAGIGFGAHFQRALRRGGQ